MAGTTKTLNPLPFEHLEPHRFEDLVRQLTYGFRPWRALEATGRSGSDEGFDIRGWEIAGNEEIDENDDPEESPGIGLNEDRSWLIQCKREKMITPSKLIDHLEKITLDSGSPLHGLMLVAPCDFSKKTRDNFRVWCASHQIAEYYLWGRAELEDLLFQRDYDHLLFAYFGISIQIRKRSARTRLRSLLSIKRQVVRHLGGVNSQRHLRVLLRDPDAREYPYKEDVPEFDERPTWRVYEFIGHWHSGVVFRIKTHFAYIASNGVKWDYEKRIRTDNNMQEPWAPDEDETLTRRARHFWDRLPPENRGTFELTGCIQYEDILAIDEHGDDWHKGPHMYVTFNRNGNGPFSGVQFEMLTYSPHVRSYDVQWKDRIKHFPNTYPRDCNDHLRRSPRVKNRYARIAPPTARRPCKQVFAAKRA